MTFEAVPPGQEPKIIKPSAISLGKLKRLTIIKERRGMIEYWRRTVVKIHLGSLRILLNSSILIVTPIPSITKPKRYGIVYPKFEKNSVNIKLKSKKKLINTIKLDLYKHATFKDICYS